MKNVVVLAATESPDGFDEANPKNRMAAGKNKRYSKIQAKVTVLIDD